MTDQQFDNTRFGKGDEIEVRNYLKREIEEVEYVNFEHRTINGYKAAEIEKYIPHKVAEL